MTNINPNQRPAGGPQFNGQQPGNNPQQQADGSEQNLVQSSNMHDVKSADTILDALALQGANAQLGNINYSTIAGTMDNFPSPAEFEKKLSQFKAVIGSELGLTPEAANELAADAWLDSEVGIPVISS